MYSYSLNEENEVKFTHVDWVKARSSVATSATDPPVHIPGATASVPPPATAQTGPPTSVNLPSPLGAPVATEPTAGEAVLARETPLAAGEDRGASGASSSPAEAGPSSSASRGEAGNEAAAGGGVQPPGGDNGKHLASSAGLGSGVVVSRNSRDEDAPAHLLSLDLEDEKPAGVAELGKVLEQTEEPTQAQSPEA